jgi:cell division protein ZapB
MDTELLDLLEKRLESLLLDYVSLRQETARLKEDNQRLVTEREGFKARIDAILTKLEGI